MAGGGWLRLWCKAFRLCINEVELGYGMHVAPCSALKVTQKVGEELCCEECELSHRRQRQGLSLALWFVY